MLKEVSSRLHEVVCDWFSFRMSDVSVADAFAYGESVVRSS